MAQLVGCHPMNCKVASLTPGQGCLYFLFSYLSRVFCYQELTDISAFFILLFILFFLLKITTPMWILYYSHTLHPNNLHHLRYATFYTLVSLISWFYSWFYLLRLNTLFTCMFPEHKFN